MYLAYIAHGKNMIPFCHLCCICLPGDQGDGCSSQCELTLCTRDRGGPRCALVHKSPLGRDTSTAYVYWPEQITSDFRVVLRGKDIHFCHMPPRRAETFVSCSSGHLAQQ